MGMKLDPKCVWHKGDPKPPAGILIPISGTVTENEARQAATELQAELLEDGIRSNLLRTPHGFALRFIHDNN